MPPSSPVREHRVVARTDVSRMRPPQPPPALVNGALHLVLGSCLHLLFKRVEFLVKLCHGLAQYLHDPRLECQGLCWHLRKLGTAPFFELVLNERPLLVPM